MPIDTARRIWYIRAKLRSGKLQRPKADPVRGRDNTRHDKHQVTITRAQ